MKAVRLHDRSGPGGVFFEDAPIPGPRPGDALVRVHATGITPAELTWSETYENADGSSRVPSIPGHEICGVVEAVAADVVVTTRAPSSRASWIANVPTPPAPPWISTHCPAESFA